MINHRKKSLFYFAAMGALSSSVILFIVLGFGQAITYMFISLSIFFSGIWGYILGRKFEKIDKKSKNKALLLGVVITTLAVVTTVIFSAATSYFIIGNGFIKGMTDMFTFSSIAILVAMPVAIPFGLFAVTYIHESYECEKNA